MADQHQSYILLSLIGLITFIALRTFFRKIRSTVRFPPTPTSLPIIGHLHLLAPIPHQSLHKLANRHGPLMRILLGSVPCVVVSSADMAKEFLKTHEAFFSNRPKSVVLDYITYGSQDFAFAPYGPYWKFMKKLCMSELLSGQRLELLLPTRREELCRLVMLVSGKAEHKESIDVGDELIKMIMNVTTRMIMNTTCSDSKGEVNEMLKVVRDIAELTGKFNLSDYIWFCKNIDLQGFRKRVNKVHSRFDSWVERIIKEHEEARTGMSKNEEGIAKDLLHVLLDISEDTGVEMKLTRENIKAFILDIFAAGTHTAALTTQWALAELINHPNIMRRARQEIDSVVGMTRLVEESDITNLPYLQAIVKETLRLHPAGPMILRESSVSCNIRGYDIPAKTRVFINLWAIMRDPSHWENPLEYVPERFLVEEGSGKSQMDVRGQHFELLPFGSGRRGCPGTSLALQIVQTSVAALIQCFEWGLAGGKETVDMEEGVGLTLSMAHPLVCFPVARLAPFPELGTT